MALVSLKYKCICPWNVFKYCTSLQHRDHVKLLAGQNCKQCLLLLRWWMNLHWTDPAPSVWVSGAGRLVHRRTFGRICGSCAPLCSAHRFETSPADSEICILHIPCSTGNILRISHQIIDWIISSAKKKLLLCVIVLCILECTHVN